MVDQKVKPLKMKSNLNFKVLEYNQTCMARLGIHSQNLNDLSNEFFKSPIAYLILSITVLFTIISSVVYIFRNSSNFESSMQAFIVTIAGVQTGGMFISIGYKMKIIKNLHIKLQNFIDAGNCFLNISIFLRISS